MSPEHDPGCSPQPFRFMGLPEELKGMLYDQLWESHKHMSLSVQNSQWLQLQYRDANDEEEDEYLFRVGVASLYSRSYTPQIGLSRCPLTSPGLLNEGLAQLFRKAKWGGDFNDPGEPHSMPGKSNPPVGVSKVTNFTVKAKQWHKVPSWVDFLGNRINALEIDEEGLLPDLDRYNHLLPLVGDNVKVLNFEIKYGGEGNLLNRGFVIDLSKLHGGKIHTMFLDEMNVSLDFRDDLDMDHPDIFVERLRIAMEAEFLRMGELLVGRGGQMRVKEELSGKSREPSVLDFKYRRAGI